ncbi:MAG TPA: cupin domain-containing protein, partial [Steroidobacteraceae bacterium]
RDKLMRSTTRSIVPLLSIALAVGIAVAADPPASGAPTATQSAISRKILSTIDVPTSNYQVIEAKVEIAANTRVPKHTHPGTVVGYLLEGDYSIQLQGQPVKVLALGESFLIPAGVVHEEFAGAHAAKVLAVFTVEKGKPLTSPVE